MTFQPISSPINRELSAEVDSHAMALALAEIGIGSTLHACHLPFAGTLLSLNQTFLLTRALSLTPEQKRPFSPFLISSIAALLKCLAPMGKKLTPMLAISMQGFLYNVGVLLLGNNLLGRTLGGIFSSVWGICQPLFLYWVIGGNAFFHALEHFSPLKDVFLGFVILKILLAISVVLFTPFLSLSRFERYLDFLSRKTSFSSRPSHPAKEAFHDICKPLFLFSLGLTFFFFYLSQGISHALLWGFLRPLAFGYLLFFFLRKAPLYRLLKKQNLAKEVLIKIQKRVND